MHGPADFTLDDNWHGGFYELAIEVGDTHDDRLDQTLQAVWSGAGVQGCYARRDVEPGVQAPVPCNLTELVAHGHLRGLVTLPSGVDVVCGVLAVREGGGPDWLDFYLPVGALTREDRRVGAFPFGPDGGARSLSWRRPLDEWLAQIGRLVYDSVNHRLALIGFEASGQLCAAQLAAREPLPSGWAYLIPEDGHVRYQPAEC
jgi:hypothetical protein